MSSLLGIFLGLLIGIISGVVMIKFLIMLQSTKTQSNIMMIIGELLAIPTFWFGGPWLTTSFLTDVKLNDILEDYISSLAVTFLLLCSYSLIRYIIRMGNEIGKTEGGSNA